MDLYKERRSIPCFWERQPRGCRKADCPFLHQIPYESEDEKMLVAPFPDTKPALDKSKHFIKRPICAYEPENEKITITIVNDKFVERENLVDFLDNDLGPM